MVVVVVDKRARCVLGRLTEALALLMRPRTLVGLLLASPVKIVRSIVSVMFMTGNCSIDNQLIQESLGWTTNLQIYQELGYDKLHR